MKEVNERPGGVKRPKRGIDRRVRSTEEERGSKRREGVSKRGKERTREERRRMLVRESLEQVRIP